MSILAYSRVALRPDGIGVDHRPEVGATQRAQEESHRATEKRLECLQEGSFRRKLIYAAWDLVVWAYKWDP